MSLRDESQVDALRYLPQLLGMELTVITDNAERTWARGKLAQRDDGMWEINGRAFDRSEIDFLCVGWIDREKHETATVIVLDEPVGEV